MGFIENKGALSYLLPACVVLLSVAEGQDTAAKVHPVPVSAQEAGNNEFCAGCHDNGKGEVLHPALAAGCNTCHEFKAKGEDTIVGLTAEGPALCLQCHADKGDSGGKKRFHPPVQDNCTNCHNPHSSFQPRLLKDKQGALCLTCHEKAAGAIQHGPYGQGNCAQCHDPHGAEREHFLRTDANALCQGCHKPNEAGVKPEEAAKTVTLPWSITIPAQEYEAAPKIGLDPSGLSGHPLLRHPISGKNKRAKDPEKEAPITCLSCHQPHASSAPKLMPAGLQSDLDLCERCHK